MHTKLRSMVRLMTHRKVQILSLGLVSVIGCFALGIQTAGDIKAIATLGAEGTELRGDVDGNNRLDIQDVIDILEVARGYKDPTPDQLKADPNHDGSLTIDDALSILHTLRSR